MAGLQTKQDCSRQYGSTCSYFSPDLRDRWRNPPAWTSYESVVGNLKLDLEQSTFEARKFANEIQKALSPETREAIVNYIQAGGDEALLSERARLSAEPYKKGYERASRLNDSEKIFTENIKLNSYGLKVMQAISKITAVMNLR